MKLFRSKILGTGHFVPEKVVTNHDLSLLMDTNDEWIRERTGIAERRVCDRAKNEYPYTMSAHAAREALKSANLEPNDIDLIVFSITFPDMFFPSDASLLQNELGITNMCPCVDISAACTGWIYGLTMVNALIQTGVYKNVLLIGCEMTSGFNKWNDRNTGILFGDGSGATIIGRAEETDTSAIHQSILSNDSSKKNFLAMKTGGVNVPISHEILDKGEALMVSMNGPEVFKAAVKTMADLCQRVLVNTSWTSQDVSVFIPHQANLRIIEATANRLEFPMEKTLVNVHKYANTSSASIPIALNEAIKEGRIKRGDNLLMAAFGAGLTSGAVTLTY